MNNVFASVYFMTILGDLNVDTEEKEKCEKKWKNNERGE